MRLHQGAWGRMRFEPMRASVIMTRYNPISVNLKATKSETGGEAEGNCVAAKRGGKQPKAKEQSQPQVNSIQLLYSASLLATGEACAKRNLDRWHLPVAKFARSGLSSLNNSEK